MGTPLLETCFVHGQLRVVLLSDGWWLWSLWLSPRVFCQNDFLPCMMLDELYGSYLYDMGPNRQSLLFLSGNPTNGFGIGHSQWASLPWDQCINMLFSSCHSVSEILKLMLLLSLNFTALIPRNPRLATLGLFSWIWERCSEVAALLRPSDWRCICCCSFLSTIIISHY